MPQQQTDKLCLFLRGRSDHADSNRLSFLTYNYIYSEWYEPLLQKWKQPTSTYLSRATSMAPQKNLTLRYPSSSDTILVKNIYVSVDPYHLNRMKSFSSTHEVVSHANLGKAFEAAGVGKVLASGNPKFEKDDLVLGVFNWAQYSYSLVKEGSILHKVESIEFPLSLPWSSRYFPNGIDIYFDNVGGDMLEAVVENMKVFGRVAACGVISEYTNGAGKRASPNMVDVVYKRINIRGFMVIDYMSTFGDFISKTSDLLRSGKLQTIEDISFGLESIPSAFVGLFKGANIGKKIIQIADDYYI